MSNCGSKYGFMKIVSHTQARDYGDQMFREVLTIYYIPEENRDTVAMQIEETLESYQQEMWS